MLYIGLMGSVSWAVDSRNSPNGAAGEPDVTPKIYTIYNISIDERAATSNLASQSALRKAQRIGVEKLLRKILRQADYDNLPPLADREVADLVSGIEVANEKSSRVRYIADFTVHFSRDKIYNFLSAREIPFAETLSSPVAVLAVLEQAGATLLWERNNPWRTAWQNHDNFNNLVPVTVIEPSYQNRMTITAWQAQRGDSGTLRQFAEQLGSPKLYVMSARLDDDIASGQKFLDLTIFQSGETKPVLERRVLAGENTAEALYEAAIEQATFWLDNQWKEKVIVYFGHSSYLDVRILFDHKADWFEIKKRLEAISLIRKITYNNFTIRAAAVSLEHSGDIEQIILTLKQEDLILEKTAPQTVGENGETLTNALWTLRLNK